MPRAAWVQKTRSGMLLGTPAYMSPEQIKDAKDADPRADLFSAGVLFYEMLTGRPAFPAPTEFAKMTAVLTTEPEPLERVDPAFAAFGPFVVRALKKDRAERFGSALEMARALSGVSPGLGQQPLSRLPEVASIFAPSTVAAPASPVSPAIPPGSPGPSERRGGGRAASRRPPGARGRRYALQRGLHGGRRESGTGGRSLRAPRATGDDAAVGGSARSRAKSVAPRSRAGARRRAGRERPRGRIPPRLDLCQGLSRPVALYPSP